MAGGRAAGRRQILLAGCRAVRGGEPLALRGGHRAGDLGQASFGRGGGDPGQRPHLGIRHPPGRELRADTTTGVEMLRRRRADGRAVIEAAAPQVGWVARWPAC
jgi:hypothetical protein